MSRLKYLYLLLFLALFIAAPAHSQNVDWNQIRNAPPIPGSNGCLNNTGGILTWGTCGLGTPGGSNGQVQFNNSGIFGGIPVMSFSSPGTITFSSSSTVIISSGGSLIGITAAMLPSTITSNTTGTAANLSGTPTLPNGVRGVTQTVGDNSTLLATDQFVLQNAGIGTPCTVTANSLQTNNAGVFGCAGDFTFLTHTLTMGSSGILDLSAGAPTSALKLPSATGAVPTADGFIAINTTNHNLVIGSNSNTLAMAAAASGTNFQTVCTNQVITTISSLAIPTCTTITNAFIPSTQVNSSNLTTVGQANFINSTVNSVGLIATASNPATNQVKFEITGNLFQTNSSNNTSESGLNVITSTTNTCGLTNTASNPGTNQVKLEVTGIDLVTCGGTGLATLTAHAVQVGEGTSTPAQVVGGVTGTSLVATNAADPAFATPGIIDGNGGAVVTSTPYVIACDSATTLLDRSTTLRFQSGASVVTAPLHTASGCGSGMAFVLLDDGAGTLTVNRTSADTFSVFNGSTNTDGATSFTLTNGQYATLNNGSGAIWEVRIVNGGQGTVTSIATTSPITGGTITSTGTIACATCVTSASSLTSTAIMTGGGSQASQTPSATSTLSSGGAMSLAGSLTATAGNFGTSPPAFTAGTGGAIGESEGTVATGLSATDIISANSTAHCLDINYNNVEKGCILGQPAGLVTVQTVSGADYTNATVTPSSVFSWSLPATAVAQNYKYTCDIMWESTAATLVGPVFGLNISAAPTQLTGMASVQNTLAGADINGYLSNTTTGSQTLVTSSAAGVTSTNYWAKIWGTIEGSPTAGATFIINAASTSGTTASLNIRRGSSCKLEVIE